MIYHLATAEAWAAAEAAGGDYAGRPADRADGFLHFSTAEQIAESARRHRAGEAGLVLLAVDPAKLPEGLLVWETSRGGASFPHVYGTVPAAAITAAPPLGLDAAGQHVFPDPLPGLAATAAG